MKVMKLVIAFSLLTGMNSMASDSISNGGRGGGDPCEERIQVIAKDLLKWISDGGPSALDFPLSISKEDYTKQMLSQIREAKVSCVGHGDPGYPVQVDNVSKVCRFDLSSQESRITCDFKKFLSLSESNQYVLIHHEYAGLARIEIPNGSISDYTISNQISVLLLDQNQKGLSVLPGYAAELVIPSGLSLPKEAQWVLRNYFHNYCYFSMSGEDALLERAEVKYVANNQVTGYTDNVRQIKVRLNLTFGSDDTIFEKSQSVLLDNTNGSYQIRDAVGVCDRVMRYN